MTISSMLVESQTKNEMLTFLIPEQNHSHKYQKIVGTADNEFDAIKDAFFLLYKNFISSQDIDRCTFTPSCSEYAVIAIQNRGLLIGGVSAFDRLTRCNGLNLKKYPMDRQTLKFIDPVIGY